MKAMLGLLNLKKGSIKIEGKDISNLSPQDRVKEGISFVPQTKNVFAGMTVEENLEMGAFLINSDYESILDEIYDLFPILREKRSQLRNNNKNITGLSLTSTLKNYAQTGSEYTKILNQIITQNRLSDFELVKLVNSVKQIELNS